MPEPSTASGWRTLGQSTARFTESSRSLCADRAVLEDDRAAFDGEIAERHIAGEGELQRGGAGIELPVARALRVAHQPDQRPHHA